MDTITEHAHWFSDIESAEKRLEELGDDYTIFIWGDFNNPDGYAVVNREWLIEEMKKEGRYIKEVKDGTYMWDQNIA